MQKYLKIFDISQLLERLPCVSGAKREEGGGRGEEQKVKERGSAVPFTLSPIPVPFPRSSPFHFDAHYAG